ncbi:hypothetical protein HOF56_01640 [Candidatus Peribacteria bacterium]|jgi:hypothetical protein|nr:hypothetical protein [Candidatus Peribacteria bacterium]MBT4021309.1 hypothetical protein [Candidatus Peribacteria bacterium]MBT4241230.1 hypothetical protein [Candidatus Peribacteria bacterium]MBT4474255.1 hypothetical protein [Candidatus Peribacteria bacterium]
MIENKKILVIVGLVIVISMLVAPKVFRYFEIKSAEDNLATSHYSLTTNLDVPFTTQAPHGDWNMPYQEACEEASILMAIRYSFGNEIIDTEDADAGILDLVNANEEILGYPVDQTASQVLDLILEIDPNISARLVENPSVEDLKSELDNGNVIIVPAAGRELNNPFFNRPGPVYHMLVLRGYTSDEKFVANDPGTRRGEEYVYKFDTIMNAMQDWDTDHEKRVVVVSKMPTSEMNN